MATIAETYRLTRKVPDFAWNLYVCRPIAAVVVHALSGSRVTPNQVTLLAFVVAMASSVLLLALPGHAGIAIAVAVFELSYVLDCADGMLARLRNEQSIEGHHLDFLMDEIKAFAVLAAASVRLWMDHGEDARFLLSGLAGLVALASGIALTTFTRRPEIAGSAGPVGADGAPARPAAAQGIIGYVERVAKLLIHYPSYIWVAGVVGHLEVYFFPYLVVNGVYAARSLAAVGIRFGRR